jgi:3-oxoacyl-[acyl-carrier-protein] synthase-1
MVIRQSRFDFLPTHLTYPNNIYDGFAMSVSGKTGLLYIRNPFFPWLDTSRNMKKSIVIEQSEILSPLGNLRETTQKLLNGDSAIRPGSLFGVSSAFAPFPDEKCRNLRYAVSMLAESIRTKTIPPDTAVFFNCVAKGDIHSLENTVEGKNSAIDLSPLVDEQADEACRLLGFTPSRSLSISTACASGAIAVETACEMLKDGRYTHAVLFGIESLCRFVATGFNALSALSVNAARPFDSSRDGLSLGEAAALAVLSYREPLPGDILIAGAGSSNDANHRTGPSRTGDGLYRAAKAAITNASMQPGDIGAVKCHGTATQYNDAMEAKAIYRLFGDSCPPCASFKGAIGHTSGAGSLVEILIASHCLKKHLLPPTAGYHTHGVEEKITVSEAPQAISKPSILCLSAGFGGINAAVIVCESLR